MNITLQGGKQLTARLHNMGPSIRLAAHRQLGLIGEHLATYARDHFEDNGLHNRSGDLRRSITAMQVEEDAHGLRGGMLAGQGLPYGPIQEFGGTILPVNGQFLTIPLEEVLTPAGVARFTAQEAESEGYATFVKGNILYGTKDGTLYPLFVLVWQVTIPARPFAGPALDANRGWIEGRIKDAVDEGIARAE